MARGSKTMSKPFVIRYRGGEERFAIRDIEARGFDVKFRDFAENIESLSLPGGRLAPNIHDDKLEAVTVESHPPVEAALVVYSGSWGQEKLKCHDTIVIPPGCDHKAENISDLPVWLLITNFTVE
jgi:hypothetical protein